MTARGSQPTGTGAYGQWNGRHEHGARRDSWSVRCLALGSALLFLCLSCHRSEPAPRAPSTAAEATPTVATTAALPRSVAGVRLGMTVSQAEAKLGALSCRNSKAGYRLCKGGRPSAPDVRNLELYVVHDHVISVSYDRPVPSSAWDVLSTLIDRYGRPSLSGVREHDKQGRLHEIYGWKDARSMYSVRFVWRDPESEHPQLEAVATALWDRKGYDQWEAEARQRRTVPASGEQPGHPI